MVPMDYGQQVPSSPRSSKPSCDCRISSATRLPFQRTTQNGRELQGWEGLPSFAEAPADHSATSRNPVRRGGRSGGWGWGGGPCHRVADRPSGDALHGVAVGPHGRHRPRPAAAPRPRPCQRPAPGFPGMTPLGVGWMGLWKSVGSQVWAPVRPR